MTTNEQLVCNARQIQRWLCNNQGLEMAALIALLVQLTGTPMTCAAIEALASQYTCVQRQLMLPAVIALMAQLVTTGVVGGGVLSGVGPPQAQAATIATPPFPTAVYLDYTNPPLPIVWYWANSVWTPFIGQ